MMDIRRAVRVYRRWQQWQESFSGHAGRPGMRGGSLPRGGGAVHGGEGKPRGIPDVAFKETTDYAAFRRAMQANSRGENLAAHSDEEYATSRVFLSEDSKSGFALTKEGDFVNLFNNSTVKGVGKAALVKAVQMGARTLDCYEGFLPTLYAKFGFVETGRIKFNDDYAPKDWDYAKLGRPDVVFMAWRGKSRQNAAEDFASYGYQKTARYYDDWDRAKDDSKKAATD